MAEFIGNFPSLDVAMADDEHHIQWILEESLTYHSDVGDCDITVPAGFQTDLASIPEFVPRWICDVNERHVFAAIVHDYLVRNWPLSMRPFADRIFREAMGVLGVAAWKRYMMWLAVRSQTAWLQITRRH